MNSLYRSGWVVGLIAGLWLGTGSGTAQTIPTVPFVNGQQNKTFQPAQPFGTASTADDPLQPLPPPSSLQPLQPLAPLIQFSAHTPVFNIQPFSPPRSTVMGAPLEQRLVFPQYAGRVPAGGPPSTLPVTAGPQYDPAEIRPDISQTWPSVLTFKPGVGWSRPEADQGPPSPRLVAPGIGANQQHDMLSASPETFGRASNFSERSLLGHRLALSRSALGKTGPTRPRGPETASNLPQRTVLVAGDVSQEEGRKSFHRPQDEHRSVFASAYSRPASSEPHTGKKVRVKRLTEPRTTSARKVKPGNRKQGSEKMSNP